MKKLYILFLIFLVINGCNKSPVKRVDPTNMVKTLIDDMVNKGVSLFAFKKQLYHKNKWIIFVKPKFIDEDKFYFSSLVEKNKVCNKKYKEELINLKIDISKINFANIKLIPYPKYGSIQYSRNKNILQDLIKANADAVLVFSRPIFVERNIHNLDKYDILVLIIWNKNVRSFIYRVSINYKGDIIIENRRILNPNRIS